MKPITTAVSKFQIPNSSRLHWRRPWCWERLKAGREGDNRGWDSWMASPTCWTWVWANSGSWWWTGKPACCDLWGRKELDTIEWLNWLTEPLTFFFMIRTNIFGTSIFHVDWTLMLKTWHLTPQMGDNQSSLKKKKSPHRKLVFVHMHIQKYAFNKAHKTFNLFYQKLKQFELWTLGKASRV